MFSPFIPDDAVDRQKLGYFIGTFNYTNSSVRFQLNLTFSLNIDR